MPLQNRVTPSGDIVATSARGTLMGNRGGCFHDMDRRLKKRPYASRQWICCVLDFKNRHRIVMSPGLYTELFFLDEATALSAGHRPCFECRRDDATRFAQIWSERTLRSDRIPAPEMDDALQPERIDGRHRKVTYRARAAALPDGVFCHISGQAHLKWRGQMRRWAPDGYAQAAIVPADDIVDVLTPVSIVAQIAAGYTPKVHPSISAE